MVPCTTKTLASMLSASLMKSRACQNALSGSPLFWLACNSARMVAHRCCQPGIVELAPWSEVVRLNDVCPENRSPLWKCQWYQAEMPSMGTIVARPSTPVDATPMLTVPSYDLPVIPETPLDQSAVISLPFAS